ncbi:MAG: hypothetical protein OER95_03780 [Acidimicrobiia bacterium]|nr:hypothetical protein [Acidimicrobiia bacterium]
MTEPLHFEYDLDPRFLPIWLPFGVRKGQGVTIDDDTLTATYGLAKLRTPLSNVNGGHITENYRWWTSVGIRLSFADSGLTFGTNNKRGVCIHFADKVGGVIPRRTHRALTVTVKDCEGLVEAIGLDEPA